MMTKEWKIKRLSDLPKVAAEFLEFTKDKSIFTLYGSMGVGKTTFIKAVAEVLGVEDEVNSPTFSIVNEYVTALGDSIFHFDFYRIKDPSEALDFGYEEYFYSGNKCFIEWPEKISNLIPQDAVLCEFEEKDDGSRVLKVSF